MAKTAKLKTKATTKSLSNPRSRASKRLTSPSIDLDKSVLLPPSSPPPASHPSRADVLAPRPNAGVVKAGVGKQKSGSSSSKRGNARSRTQKARQEKTLARAEAVVGKLEKKVVVSGTREGRRRERRRVWEEVNGVARRELEVENGVGAEGEGPTAVAGAPGGWVDVQSEDGSVSGDGDGDEEMEGIGGSVVNGELEATATSTDADAPAVAVNGHSAAAENGVTSGQGADEDDEIT